MLSFTTSVPAMADINVYSADRQLVEAWCCNNAPGRSPSIFFSYDLATFICGALRQNRERSLSLLSTLPIIQALTPELAAKGWVVSGYSLRMIITTWLDKFTLGFADVDSGADQLIVQSGIYDRMRNGSVEVVES